MTRNLFPVDTLEQVYEGAIRVLGEMGMRVHNRQALEALEAYGATLDYPKQCASFSPKIIERMLEAVRADHAQWQRTKPHLPKRLYRGGGGTCPYYFDDEKWEKRRADEDDAILCLKIQDTAPFVGGEMPVYNCSVPSRFEPIRCLQLGIEVCNRTEIAGMDLFFPEQVPFAVELGKLYKNDARWFLPCGNCPTTPLTVGKTIADLAVAIAPYQQVYVVPTMPVMGANAPITPLGAAVVGVAEILGGWILAKALNPQTPVAAGALSARMDMKTGKVKYVTPEVFIADTAIVEVFEVLLNLPCRCNGKYIDVETPGLQAVYEQMMRSVACGLFSDINGFDGTLDQGRVFSPTQLMLDCDVNHLMAAYTDDPALDEDQLAVETILNVGFESEGYMMHEHTMRHMRQAFESKILYARQLVDSLGSEGDILTHAREQWHENLKTYEPPDHSDDFLRDLHDICDKAKKSLLS